MYVITMGAVCLTMSLRVFVCVWTVHTLYHVVTDSHPQNNIAVTPKLFTQVSQHNYGFWTAMLSALQTIEAAKETVYWINFFFTLLFTVEAILKMTALHPVVQNTYIPPWDCEEWYVICFPPPELFQEFVEFSWIPLYNWSTARVHSSADGH